MNFARKFLFIQSLCVLTIIPHHNNLVSFAGIDFDSNNKSSLVWNKIPAILLLAFSGIFFGIVIKIRHGKRKLLFLEEELIKRETALHTIVTDKAQLLVEKDMIVKKVHHRVKNNLQIMLSLLHTQSAYLTNPAAIKAIDDSQGRMQTMIVIQRKLYESEDVSLIAMEEFIEDLVRYLLVNHPLNSLLTTVTVEEISLDVTRAGFIGLLINETLLHIFKCFGPAPADGTFSIKFKITDMDSIVFTMSYINHRTDYLEKIKDTIINTGLMREVTHQLNGSFKIERRDKLRLSFEFSKTNQVFRNDIGIS